MKGLLYPSRRRGGGGELSVMEEDDTNVFGVDPEDLEDVEELLLNDFDIEDSTGCLKKMPHSDLILWVPIDTFLFLPWYLVHLNRIPGHV